MYAAGDVESKPGGGPSGVGFCGVQEATGLLEAAATNVVTVQAEITADIDADRAVGHGTEVKVGPFEVGLELLGEVVAQLLHAEPFDVEGAQRGQVAGAVGSNQEGPA